MTRMAGNTATKLAGFGHRWLLCRCGIGGSVARWLLRLSMFQISTGMAIVLGWYAEPGHGC